MGVGRSESVRPYYTKLIILYENFALEEKFHKSKLFCGRYFLPTL